MESPEPSQLNDSVYEFYRPHDDIDLEIVAFHGLRFSDYKDAYKTTWQRTEKDGTRCWLRDSLAMKFPRARILSVSYDSSADVSDEAGRMSFSNIGRILVQDIIHLAEVGQRGCPVVLIGYCLGGLVIKQLCTEAEKQYDQAPDGSSKGRLDRFLTNVRSVVFLDTPHAGSGLRDYLRREKQCDGPVLEYLSKSSSALGRLNNAFDSLALEREWERLSCWYYWVTLAWDSLEFSTPGLEVVQEESAKSGHGQGNVFLIPADHSGKAVSSTWSQLDEFLEHLHDVLEKIMKRSSLLPPSKLKEISKFTVNRDRRETQLKHSLYEMYRPDAEKDWKLELIFFPGSLHKDAYKSTWMAEDNKHCWLQTWLPEAFPTARICAVSYASHREDQEFDPVLICENLIQDIIYDRDESWRPVILVGHCFGGLVIKELCNQVEAALHRREIATNLQEFIRSVRGIAYYGTSHSGYSSDYKPQKLLSGGVNVNPSGDFSERSVGRLNTGYMRFITDLGWKELALGETRPTQEVSGKKVFVDEFSASSGVQRNSFFSVAADHFSLCKPKSRLSNSFLYLEHFIHSTMNEAQYRNMNVRRKKCRGIAIIISMEEDKPGSDIDRHQLRAMVEYLKFWPVHVVNKRANDLPSTIEEILKEVVEEDDESIFCFVGAHGAVLGGKQLIYDNTHEENVDFLSGILRPIADCLRLVGKPKVFLVNASRAIIGQEGGATVIQQEQNDLEGTDDCLLMYSTRLGTNNWRGEEDDKDGTVFVSEVKYLVNLLYQTTDVEDIFKSVQQKIAELAERNNAEQSPVLHSSLRKRLSWRPR